MKRRGEPWKTTVNAPGGTRDDWGVTPRQRDSYGENKEQYRLKIPSEKSYLGHSQPLGKVLVSSGKHSQSGIKRESTRLGFCGTGRALGGTRNRSFFGCRAVRQDRPVRVGIETRYLPGMTKSTEFSDVKCSDYCVKRGRTTGVTAGVCHGTEAHINWSLADQKLHCESNQPACNRTHARRYKEEVILNKKRYSRIINYNLPAAREIVTTQDSFCAAGDSGSII
jgi:hypothetical protein